MFKPTVHHPKICRLVENRFVFITISLFDMVLYFADRGYLGNWPTPVTYRCKNKCPVLVCACVRARVRACVRVCSFYYLNTIEEVNTNMILNQSVHIW